MSINSKLQLLMQFHQLHRMNEYLLLINKLSWQLSLVYFTYNIYIYIREIIYILNATISLIYPKSQFLLS